MHDFDRTLPARYYLLLGKMEVYSGGKEIAVLCPENVIDASTWKPPVQKARVPLTGVTLDGGVFQSAPESNILYLLNSYSVDDLLRQFRERAGTANPPVKPTAAVQFWEEDLAGSNAGRFLMAAGNTLRWVNHPEVRRRLDAVVDGIAECRQPNAYIMAYPEGTFFYSERGGYPAWLTHARIEASYVGNPKAFEFRQFRRAVDSSQPCQKRFSKRALRPPAATEGPSTPESLVCSNMAFSGAFTPSNAIFMQTATCLCTAIAVTRNLLPLHAWSIDPTLRKPARGMGNLSVYTRPLSDSPNRTRRLSFVCVSSDGTREEPPLTLDTILTELKAERDRLNRAIAALEETTACRTETQEGS